MWKEKPRFRETRALAPGPTANSTPGPSNTEAHSLQHYPHTDHSVLRGIPGHQVCNSRTLLKIPPLLEAPGPDSKLLIYASQHLHEAEA